MQVAGFNDFGWFTTSHMCLVNLLHMSHLSDKFVCNLTSACTAGVKVFVSRDCQIFRIKCRDIVQQLQFVRPTPMSQ